MGNAQEIQLTDDPFVDSEELLKHSRDFLSVQSHRNVETEAKNDDKKMNRNDTNSHTDGDETDEGPEESDEQSSSKSHQSKKVTGKKRRRDDDDWSEYNVCNKQPYYTSRLLLGHMG